MYTFFSNLPIAFSVHFVIGIVLLIVAILGYLNLRSVGVDIPTEDKTEVTFTYRFLLSISTMLVVLSFAVIIEFELNLLYILANGCMLYAAAQLILLSLPDKYQSITFKLGKYLELSIVFFVVFLIFFLPNTEDRVMRGILTSLLICFALSVTVVFRVMQWPQSTRAQKVTSIMIFVSTLVSAIHLFSISIVVTPLSVSLVVITVCIAIFFSLLSETVSEISRKKKRLILQTESVESEPESISDLQISSAQLQNQPNKRLVDKYCEWVKDNYSDPDASVDKAIVAIGTSYATLNRHLKSREMVTSKKLLNDFRLEQAKEMLQAYSSSEVAYACGFKTPSHFAQSFKIKYGITPTTHKKEYCELE